jgi:hypothetical protein
MLYKGKCDTSTKFIFKIDEFYGVLMCCSIWISIKWVILKKIKLQCTINIIKTQVKITVIPLKPKRLKIVRQFLQGKTKEAQNIIPVIPYLEEPRRITCLCLALWVATLYGGMHVVKTAPMEYSSTTNVTNKMHYID